MPSNPLSALSSKISEFGSWTAVGVSGGRYSFPKMKALSSSTVIPGARLNTGPTSGNENVWLASASAIWSPLAGSKPLALAKASAFRVSVMVRNVFNGTLMGMELQIDPPPTLTHAAAFSPFTKAAAAAEANASSGVVEALAEKFILSVVVV